MVKPTRQQTALEAAILAHMIAQGERLARAAAALKVEARFRNGQEVQTEGGGMVLQNVWEKSGLEPAILAYLKAQGDRLARTAAALADETEFQGEDEARGPEPAPGPAPGGGGPS